MVETEQYQWLISIVIFYCCLAARYSM